MEDEMREGIVRNWMTSPVVTITPETHPSDARRIMNAENIRALPVVKANRLVGIITRRGLLRLDPSSLDGSDLNRPANLHRAAIGDIMTANPLTVLPTTLVPKAARILLENKITTLPVLDESRILVGIFTSSDIFRCILSELPLIKPEILVQEYMTSEVIKIDPDTSLLECHRLMGTERIRALPVLEDDKLVGLVTRTDLMSSDPSRYTSTNNQEMSLRILTQPAEQIMSRGLTVISLDAPITEAARLMLDNKIHCLPVLNAEKKLAGIITESDLFRLVIRKFF
jgi:CBS domain-containing protein